MASGVEPRQPPGPSARGFAKSTAQRVTLPAVASSHHQVPPAPFSPYPQTTYCSLLLTPSFFLKWTHIFTSIN